MIIIIQDAERMEVKQFSEDQVRISVLDSHIRFILHENRYLMRLPHNLVTEKKVDIADDVSFRVTSKTSLRSAVITLSFNDSGYDAYEYYSFSDKVSVGSSASDVIRIRTVHMTPCALQIDPEQKKIIINNREISASLNGVMIHGEISYENGDRFAAVNAAVVLHDAFLMVNTCGNISVNMPLYQGKTDEILAPDLRKIRYIQYPYHLPEGQFRCEIVPAEKIREPAERMLILSVGPSLMMASASLTAALLNMYYGYLNGREPAEMIPMLIFPVMMLLSTLIWLPLQRYSERRSYIEKVRKRDEAYAEYGRNLIAGMTAYYNTYRQRYEEYFPSCRYLYDVLQNQYPSVVIKDDCGLSIRLGVSQDLIKPEVKLRMETGDPMSAALRNDAEEAVKTMKPLPFVTDLSIYRKVFLNADSDYLHYLLMQIFLYYRSRKVSVVLLTEKDQLNEWHWLFHVPHMQTGGIRTIAVTEREAGEIRRILNDHTGMTAVIRTGKNSPEIHDDSVTVIDLQYNSRHYDAVIEVKGETGIFRDFLNRRQFLFIPDSIPAVNNESLLPSSFKQFVFSAERHDFFSLYGILSAKELDIENRWQANRANDGLVCLIGMDEAGETIRLDLHENVNGPHGLIAGTTGSGKSELLLTMILSLAVNYSPDELKIVLIDFKGGSLIGALNGRHRLPHLAGLLSNLDPDDMKRALVSIGLECRKREKLLRKMAEYTGRPVMNVSAYRSAYHSGCGLPYLPDLLIIIDEFAELKRDRPDFMDELISTARVGRSLGIHLILCTQKPGGIVNDQIRSNTRFRICLKTAEKQDSQEVIQCSDACGFSRPGMFAVLCDGVLKKGIAGYTGASSEQDESLTEIFDLQGSVKAISQNSQEKGTIQLTEVLETIHEAGSRKKSEMMWLDELREISADELLKAEGIMIGRIDDYYQRQYRDIIPGPPYGNNYAVFSASAEERERFIRAFLYSYAAHTENDRLFILDDMHILSGKRICDVRTVTDVFDSRDENRIRELMKYLRNGDQPCMNWLLVTDYTMFCSASAGNHDDLMYLLEHSGYLNLCLMIIAGSSKSITYRDLRYFREKLVLKSVGEEETREIFAVPERLKVKNINGGIVKGGHLVPFVFGSVSEQELTELSEQCIAAYGTDKDYVIPSMPEYVSLRDYSGSGLPLGIYYTDYSWAVLKKEEQLVVICSYREDYEVFFKYLDLVNAEIRKNADTLSEGQIFYLYTLAEFRRTPVQDELMRLPVLYLGDDFTQQYFFPVKVRKLNDGDGLMIRKKKCEVIRLVERL